MASQSKRILPGAKSQSWSFASATPRSAREAPGSRSDRPWPSSNSGHVGVVFCAEICSVHRSSSMKSIELRFFIEVQVDPTWSNKFWVCLWIWDPPNPWFIISFPVKMAQIDHDPRLPQPDVTRGTSALKHQIPKMQKLPKDAPFPYVVTFKLMNHWNTP